MHVNKQDNTFFLFAVSLIMLMLADVITTKLALGGGVVQEANGFMASIVSNTALFIVVKIVAIVLILGIMSVCMKRNETIAKTGMYVIIIMYVGVFVNNMYWIMRYT